MGIPSPADPGGAAQKLTETARPDSPWSQAWRRLRRNRMAMGGLVVVLVMAFAAATAPWIVPFDPRDMERWTGSLPPGTRHLELRNEMSVTAGAVPRERDVPPHVFDVLGDGDEHVWELDLQVEETALLRLTMDGPKIQKIGEGGRSHTKLELAPEESLRVKEGRKPLATRLLEVGGTLPEGTTAQTGRHVVVVERVKRSPSSKRTLAVRFAGDGKVREITGTAEGDVSPEGEVRVRAEDVQDVCLDGTRREHTHLLGTDQEGRDTLSRVITGAQISLLIGLVATLVSLSVGVLWGAVAGYAGGRVDVVMMRVVDVLYALPYVFLVIIIMVAFGRSLVMLFVALGLVQWLTLSRVVRGQILSLKEREFVDAARTLGTPPSRILLRHLVPNTMGVIVVFATLTVPAVILEESFLAFIGLTVQFQGEPVDSWGALVDYGRTSLGSDGERWWLLVVPAAAMSLTLFSLNFLGDGLRDALDPRQKGRG